MAVCSYQRIPGSVELAEAIAARLESSAVHAVQGTLVDPALRGAVLNGEVDLLIALGGDGTMLRAGQLCGPQHVPVLGINLGHLGFLIEVERDQWEPAVDRLLSGDYWLEARMMLRVTWLQGERRAG